MKAFQKKTIVLPFLPAAVPGATADDANAPQSLPIEKSVIKQSAIALIAAEMASVVAGSYLTLKAVITAYVAAEARCIQDQSRYLSNTFFFMGCKPLSVQCTPNT